MLPLSYKKEKISQDFLKIIFEWPSNLIRNSCPALLVSTLSAVLNTFKLAFSLNYPACFTFKVKTIDTLALNSLLLLFSFDACVAHSETPDFNPQLLCASIANNTRIMAPTACNRYITCINQIPIIAECPHDLFYDRNKRSCVAASSIKCYSSDPCAATPNVNGFVADPYACNAYYYCQSSKGSQGFCSPGMNFNPETKNCLRNYECKQTLLPDDYCNIVPDGVFIKVANSCISYQLCWHDRLINGKCPATFYFNALLGACDYSENVNCTETAIKPTIAPANINCSQPGIFIADGVSCNGYYYCKGYKDGSIELIPGKCPFWRFFDAKNGGACVIRTSMACTHNRCVTLGYRSIQLANINNDGCTGFQICQAGEIIGRSQCPGGQYFNELLQLCTTKVVKYPACGRFSARVKAEEEKAS